MLWEAPWHWAGPSVDFVGTQRGPSAHSQPQGQLAASCSVSSYFKSCWILSSLLRVGFYLTLFSSSLAVSHPQPTAMDTSLVATTHVNTSPGV